MRILEKKILTKLDTFGVKSVAEYFCELKNDKEIMELSRYFRKRGSIFIKHMNEKQSKLDILRKQIEQDKNLPLSTNLVFGEGDINCKVLFIGEAPGEKEDETGRPFVGRAGQLLTKSLEEIGWKREDVYITNIVKRRPPFNRDPLPEEIALYKPYLTKQIEIISPLLIATLGRFSMNYFLPEAKIMKDQGKLFRVKDYFIYPILHPAAALRGNAMMAIFKESIKRLPRAAEKAEKLKSGK